MSALGEITTELAAKLSNGARICIIDSSQDFEKNFSSWSGFNRKEPSAIVKIATEEDAVHTVSWASQNNIPFVVKAGGHSVFCSIGKGGFIIDLENLNEVTVNEDRAVIQGGALTEKILDAVYKKGCCIVSGTCDTVSLVGAVLGGGVGPLQGMHGLMCDNLLSARMVSAAGKLVTVSQSENSELFWALKGAGQSLGLVTEMTMKVHPLSTIRSNDGTFWNAMLVWGEQQLADVTRILNTFPWSKKTAAYLLIMCPPPNFKPALVTFIDYFGSTAEAEEEFASLLKIGPLVFDSKRLPYSKINDLEKPLCATDGKKSQFGVGLKSITPEGMAHAWKIYANFLEEYPDAVSSSVVIEIFGMDKVRELDWNTTAFHHRDINFWGFALAWYEKTPDSAAAKFGYAIRDALREADSNDTATAYINFNRGDESKEMCFGSDESRLKKLMTIKKDWDPNYIFGDLVKQLG